jgi:hypothetical protein
MAAAHANCTRVAASRMQISVDFIHVACDWQPRKYNFYATGGQLHANFACASSQLRAKPPVFCKHAARTII